MEREALVESMTTTPEKQANETRPLRELLRGVVAPPVPPEWREHLVSGVFDDSRRVEPGGVFVAIRGGAVDGRKFVGDALARGAAVLIGDGLSPVDKVLVVNVPDPRKTLALLAVRWHGLESLCRNDLLLLGITGTNGKTTAGFMTQAILQAGGWKCGLLGTIRYDLCGEAKTAGMTTPGPLELAGYLRRSSDNGARAVVMEVSSHALDQRRTDGLRFAAAAFTNLTRDHLDYHKTFEAYREAKARLFRELDDSAKIVLNVDDPNADTMRAGWESGVITYALDRPADLTASSIQESFNGTSCRLRLNDEAYDLTSRMVGRHNVYNALTAAGLARAVGMPNEAIISGLSALRHVPGRLQRAPGAPEIGVFIDYAHTPDAVYKAAGVLKPLARKRLIVVFGCGGDRDREKRPMMARAASEFADAIIVTSDNPRTEDPRDIINDIMPGFDENARRRVLVDPDRRGAIHAAVSCAAEGDVVLVAGKGHEDYQIIGAERRHFDDMETALEALSVKAGAGDE